MRGELGVLLVAALGLKNLIEFTPKVDLTLRFNQNHEFTILQFTDLHYGESEEKNQNNMMIQQKLIDYIKPDMAVLTGDMVSGYAWDGKSKDFYYNNWKQFTKSFLDNKLKYAYALGNHDHQADYNYEQIGKLENTHPYSLFTKNEVPLSNSLTNYQLEIKSSFKNKENETTTSLWMFDSKDHTCEGIDESWGCITQDQIEWYEKRSKNLNEQYNKIVNGFSFFHIPIPEFATLWNFYPTRGNKEEPVGCPRKNTGLFSKMKQLNNMKAIFCGHDHNSDYSGFYKDIELIYGRKTGFGSYGPKYVQRGATVIKLKEFINEKGETDFTYQHYVIQLDGTYDDRVHDYKYQGRHYFQRECSY